MAKNNKIPYLIAIDSDGTLKNSNGEISNRSKIIIKKLIDKGNIIVICTARPRYHTLEVAKEVNSSDYLISSNGTELYNNICKNVIYSSYLSKKICKKIYCDCMKNELRCIFVCDNTEYATEFVRNDYQILLDDNNVEDMLNNNIKQIMIISKNKVKVREYKKIIKERKGINITDSSNNNKDELWFSIISNKSSKGKALKELAKYLKIPIKNTIAIGNDKNDISMFEIAGTSVAVNNASKTIKNKADYVTLSNDEDGVAIYLESLLKD